MILIVSLCRDSLHEKEFVDPVVSVVETYNLNYKIVHYQEITPTLLQEFHKVILCGTSLQDNEYLNHIDSFAWLVSYKGEVLGICAGMQIIGLVYGGKIKRFQEIGLFEEQFHESFLGLQGPVEVYHLHTQYIDFSELKMFQRCAGKTITQAVTHKEKPFFGVLFHPEVRNKELIKNFILQ